MTTDENPYVSMRFDFLDLQVIDRDGIPVGRVDDLALEVRHDGAYVTHLLTGQRALGARMTGVLGTVLRTIAATAATDVNPREARAVPVDEIEELRPQVKLRRPLRELEIAGLERWLADRLVSRLPGSRK
ncbi:hypothetical protein [Mycobacterium sp. IS-3022]|uniref:hypothetical protein n=1 Tax=Mycobacterium sp. IS-3022 TaxID=1772277 RepID=UPI000A4CEC89|nr:hypothetical protein [Mycobacterium sp. IS-3022]